MNKHVKQLLLFLREFFLGLITFVIGMLVAIVYGICFCGYIIYLFIWNPDENAKSKE